jgi:hypothetical protein
MLGSGPSEEQSEDQSKATLAPDGVEITAKGQ